jgi:hypothetical protein
MVKRREDWHNIIRDVAQKTQFATSSGVFARLFLVDALSFWQHALMKYARYHNAPCFDPIKHDMPGMLHAAQAGPDMIARAA